MIAGGDELSEPFSTFIPGWVPFSPGRRSGIEGMRPFGRDPERDCPGEGSGRPALRPCTCREKGEEQFMRSWPRGSFGKRGWGLSIPRSGDSMAKTMRLAAEEPSAVDYISSPQINPWHWTCRRRGHQGGFRERRE